MARDSRLASQEPADPVTVGRCDYNRAHALARCVLDHGVSWSYSYDADKRLKRSHHGLLLAVINGTVPQIPHDDFSSLCVILWLRRLVGLLESR